MGVSTAGACPRSGGRVEKTKRSSEFCLDGTIDADPYSENRRRFASFAKISITFR